MSLRFRDWCKMTDEIIYPDSDNEPELPKQTVFTILTNERLPFNYHVQRDGTCITDGDQSGIALAEQLGYIKILKEDVPANLGMFSGEPEPILNGNLKFVQPCKGKRGLEGEALQVRVFGDWKCQRCGYINHISIEKGKPIKSPFVCFNDDCGRKGPFKEEFPTELVKPIWRLPLSPIPSHGVEIYTEIYNFCRKYLVLKPDEYYILADWIMSSWLVDDFQTCPYLCLIAPKSSGKSQVLNVLGALAYRAVSAISVTAASLFRAIELWHITLLIDEAEYQVKLDSEAGQALYGCLNGGYKRGSYAIRIEGDNSSRVPASYDVFGFKAIASTRLFHPTLESRSIIFNMSQGMPSKILIDMQEADLLRSKLLYWRFETLGKLPQFIPESKNGRLIEMFIPLFTVAQVLKDSEGVKKPISYEDLIKLLNNKIREMESQRKEEERGSVEAKIIGAIDELEGEKPKEGFGERTEIAVKEIAEHLKWDDPKAAANIGRKLKVMGIKTKHTNHGNVIDILDQDVMARLEELKKRYSAVKDGEGK